MIRPGKKFIGRADARPLGGPVSLSARRAMTQGALSRHPRVCAILSAPCGRRAMNLLTKAQGELLSVLRIMSGLLFLQHGTQKMLSFPSFPDADPAWPALFTLSWFAGIIEFVGGTLITLGLFTRLAAFICSGQMAVAYFYAHAPNSFFPLLNNGDAAILYCFIFLYIAAAGPGPWSLDALLRTDRRVAAGAE
jgi:putative oxidoreductase